MQTFEKRSAVPATAAELFAWHARDGAFERLNPSFDPLVIEERGHGLDVGSRAVVRMKLGPIEQRFVAVHTACEPGVMFKDEQQQGPFSKWEHTHRFFDGELFDHVDYQLPMGPLGQAVAGHFSEAQLERVFSYRHTLTRADLERHAKFAGRPRLVIAITGASGLIGSALSAYLSTAGHTVRAVKRGDFSAVDGADAVIHLAGANIGQRWSKQHRIDIVTSRVEYTRALVDAISAAKKPPSVLLSGSAVGIYGDRGGEAMDESSPIGAVADEGAGFLVTLCQQWEAEALKATAQRVVLLRTGVVLSARGGALHQMLPGFRAGGGGPLGSGKQHMSWISLEDVLGAVEHALFTETVKGPMNLTAPVPVTNAELSSTLGRVLSRPSVLKVPAFALRLLFGEAADAAFLASQNAKPGVLLASGFQFLQPDLEQCLRFTLGK